MNITWIWFVVGFVPYNITTSTASGERMLQVHALFWSLDIVSLQNGRYRGILRIPLIEWLGRDKPLQP